MIEWETNNNAVLCSKCQRPLTLPHAHIHFHYGPEGLSDAARDQLAKLAGCGFGDDVGALGRDVCMACFREILSLIAAWRDGGR